MFSQYHRSRWSCSSACCLWPGLGIFKQMSHRIFLSHFSFSIFFLISNKCITAFFFSNRSSRPRMSLLKRMKFWAITFFSSSPTSGECRSRAVLSTFRRSSSKRWRDFCPLWRFSPMIWFYLFFKKKKIMFTEKVKKKVICW